MLFRGSKNFYLLAAALLWWLPLKSFAAAVPDQLHFLDGSVLLGALHSIDARHEVRWRHPGARQPIEFMLTNLHQVRLGHARPAMTNGPATCRFRFTNGDEVLGELVSLDAETVELDTWFAGRLRAPRRALRAVAVMAGGHATLYEGPASAEGWKIGQNTAVMGNRIVLGGGLINFDPAALQAGRAATEPKGTNAWLYRNGAFYSVGVGVLARNFSLPSQSRVEFDLAWKGTPNLRFALYTDGLDSFDHSGGYQFYLSSSYIYMMRRSGAGAGAMVSPSASVRLPTMSQKNRLRLELRCNNEKGTVALFVDGVLAQEWKDGGAPLTGKGIAFLSQRTDLAVRISNLKVSAWDGRNDEALLADDTTETTILLANGDRVSGRLDSIHDGKLALDTLQARLNIPLRRAVQIQFAGDTGTPPARLPGEIQAGLHGGEKVSLKLEQWESGQARGASAVFGPMQLQPQWVRLILFNPGQPRVAADEFAFPGDWAYGGRE